VSTTTTDELIDALAELRGLFPDWRLGQLVLNVATAAGAGSDDGIWDIDDQQFLAAARRLIERNAQRRGDTNVNGSLPTQ
jgi:hypothetical protein